MYEHICGNYASAVQIALKNQETLAKISNTVDPGRGLQSLLIKPVQRICRYPLILKELVKLSTDIYPYLKELEQSLESVKRVTDRVNESQRLAENQLAKEDLLERMEDWKVSKLT